MRYVAAYMLAVVGGNANPTAKDIKSILSSVGVEADKKNLDRVVTALKGKKIEVLMAEGMSKLASVPSAAGSAAAPKVAAAAPVVKEEKKKETSEEESDGDMGMGLFD